MQFRTVAVLAATLAAAVLVSGCSSFRFRSDRAAARRQPLPTNSVEGLWEGRWYDLENPKHGGKLQCVLTRTGDTLYRASTRSQWMKVFTSAYAGTVMLTPVEAGAYLVQGGESLWLFGTHSMTGRVDATRFVATYKVGGHKGVMELERPAATVATATTD